MAFEITGFTSMEKRVQHFTEAVINDPPAPKQVDIKPWFDYNTTATNHSGNNLAGSTEGVDFSIQKHNGAVSSITVLHNEVGIKSIHLTFFGTDYR